MEEKMTKGTHKIRKALMEKILSQEKTELNVYGHIYTICLYTNDVELLPKGKGSIIETVDMTSYGYTHGGEIYRAAVDAAHEIRKALIKKLSKDSDV